jgi:DNA processing protein
MISVFDILVLSQIPLIGPNRLRNLISHYKSTDEVFRATAREIANVEGYNKKLAAEVKHFLEDSRLDKAKKYAEHQLVRLNKIEGKIITFWDEHYPHLLKKIYDPPPYLFLKGEIIPDDNYALAIVGTRSPSDYGSALAEKFSKELVKLGITVVSGLARGIDTIVHTTAIQERGRTLAVIGSGIDYVYPPENKSLFERITHYGAVMSEYALGTKPDAGNFPRRNRIISGLSLGTLVVETDVDGGAMITANTALDQNREVFAIPGNISSKKSRGCHTLIKEGRAKLVESVEDMIQELEQKLKPILQKTHNLPPKPAIELTLFEKKIYDVLSENPIHIDVLSEQANVTTSDALVNLLSLEFKGLVKQLPGKMFMKI